MLSFFVGTPALRVPAPRMELRNNIGGAGKNWRPELSRAQPVQQFDELGGCGGASPFAAYAGGGSAGDQSKWANGGQWTQRMGASSPYVGQQMEQQPMEQQMEQPPPMEQPMEQQMDGSVQPVGRHAMPAQPNPMHGCGGAAPFAAYAGGGSAGDQSKWANGGQWTQRMGVSSPSQEPY